MLRVQSLLHKGKTIIVLDLSRCPPEETIKTIQLAGETIGKSKPKGALVLTDVTEATYNKDVANAIKDFVRGNTPFIKASAIVGADGVRLILLHTVTMLTRREIKTFDAPEKAMDWLVSVT